MWFVGLPTIVMTEKGGRTPPGRGLFPFSPFDTPVNLPYISGMFLVYSAAMREGMLSLTIELLLCPIAHHPHSV